MRSQWYKKKIFLCCILAFLSLALIMTGCKQQGTVKTNADILTQLGSPNVGEGTLAIIMNEPSEEEVKAFEGLVTLEQDANAQKMLIVPIHEGATLRVEQIIWSNANQDFIKGRTIYESEAMSSGDALYLHAYRPEGMPSLRIMLRSETEDGPQFGQYIISYDGKDGNPKFEVIDASAEAAKIWGEVSGSLNITPEEPEQDSQADQAAVLEYEEISHIFDLTEADLIAQFGEPTERRSEEFFEGVYYTHLYYGKSEFALDDEGAGLVFRAVIADDRITSPRGIKVGDDLNSVLDKFPNEARAVTGDQYDPEYKEQLLYGSGSYMTNYGKIIYNNDEPAEVIYATEEGITLRFILDKGKVFRVEYAVPMT